MRFEKNTSMLMFVCYSLWNLDIWKLLILVFVIDDVQRSVFLFLAIFQKKCDFRAVQRSALCRSRRELSNEYLLAKCGFDTAECAKTNRFFQ